MSADLLKEFDAFYQTQPADSALLPPPSSAFTSALFSPSRHPVSYGLRDSTRQPETSRKETWRAPRRAEQPSTKDDDDWGDFEEAPVHPASPASIDGLQHGKVDNATVGNLSAGLAKLNKYNVQRQIKVPQKPTTLDWMPFDKAAKAEQQATVGTNRLRDESILFDAEDEDGTNDDDDFGDFEGVTETTLSVSEPRASPPHVPKANLPNLSLLDSYGDCLGGLVRQKDESTTFSCSKPPDSLVEFARSATIPTGMISITRTAPSNSCSTEATTKPSRSAKKPPPQALDDETWDDFTESLPEAMPKPINATIKAVPSLAAGHERHDSTHSVKDGVVENRGLAVLSLALSLPDEDANADSPVEPVNIPSPGVILPLFLPVIQLALDRLFGPLSIQASSPAARIAVLRHPKTVTFLESYISIATVLARVIAGRKHRWKRDTLLAQSMRIGPATSARGGLKLVGVDKSENTREEKEVADIIRIWRTQSGKLRSAITSANISISVPELGETMVVRTAKLNEGAVASTKPCAFCGLKREERVAKADFRVDDTFGEWWLEHWGHKACRNFWAAKRGSLARQ